MPRSPLAGLLALAACIAWALPARALTPTPEPKAHIYTAHDEEFLYLAARVEDPFVIGAHADTMSDAWNDDAVGFYLDLPHLGTELVHPQACRLVASAAGGFMASVGTRDGTWRPAREWLAGLKLDVTVQGTLNQAGDEDRGFTVEVAIPWRFLGELPPSRARLGFNAVCFVRGENETWVSWSPGVRSESDLDRPAAWGDLLVRRTGGPKRPTETEVVCPFTPRRVLIDGKLSAGEWIGASVIELVKPPPRPIATTPTPAARPGLACALYRCDYQADPRLGPVVGPAAPGLAGAMVHQPIDAIGPWLCGQRVDWHRRQLTDVGRAGLDVILPMVALTPAGSPQAQRSLLALARALQDLRGQDRPYPLVGLYLDPAALAPEGELAPGAARAVADGVVEFFRIIPREFWAQLDPQSGLGQGRGRLALLGPLAGAGAVDEDLVAEAARAFASQFPGERLVWLADVGWRERGLAGVAGYCGLGQPGTLHFQADETFPTAVISPGYDDGRSQSITDRLDGARYRATWTKVLGLAPRLIVLRSWNDFTNATQVAPSRQYGQRDVDLTRRFTTQWSLAQPGRLRLLRETMPSVLRSGGRYSVDLLLRNASFEPLGTGERTTAGYRIENDAGKQVARKQSAYGLRLRAGETRTVVVPLSLRDDNQKPLPEGRYRVVFEVTTSKVPLFASRWFRKTLAEVSIWITVGRVPARRMALLEASAPTRMESGASYPVRLRLRNDGSTRWSAESCRLAARWYRRSDAAMGWLEPVGAGTRLDLAGPAAPGQIINLRGTLRAAAGDQPLAPGLYQLRWDVVQGEDGWFSGARPSPFGTTVEVVARDAGARFVKSDLPATLQSGSTTPVQVVVANAGRSAWEADTTRVTCHWAYWDGSPAPGPGVQAPLDRAIGPGDSAVVRVAVRAPQVGGAYHLWWDVIQADGSSASVADQAGSGSLMPSSVIVQGGPYQPLDLASHTNLGAAAPDNRRVLGNFDGLGNSLPSEFLPPDVGPIQAATYPSGYYIASAQTASPPQREVPFAYPRRSEGRMEAVACRGQTVALPGGRLARLHLLGAATGPDVSGEFVVTYEDGSTGTMPLALSDWRGVPQHGERVAFGVASFRSRQATRRGSARLYHYLLELDSGKAATSLALPSNLRIVIVAITAERAAP